MVYNRERSVGLPSIRVDVSPVILDWILSVVSLDKVDDTLRTRFYQWRNAEASPSYSQIEVLSKKIHIPLGYFFLKNPPMEHPPLLEFRTVNSTARPPPSRDLIDTYYQMEAIQELMRDYLIDLGRDELSFVGTCKNEKNQEKIVTSIRNIAGLPVDWYSHSKDAQASFGILRKYFEQAGILVLKNGVVGQNNYRSLDIEEFRAFTIIDNYAPLVFINNNDSDNAKLFSLVHEIVHIWIGLNSFYDKFNLSSAVDPLETLCNAVAAELLVPNQIFIQKWHNLNSLSDDDKFSRLVKIFKCGEMVIARKALNNTFISQGKYKIIENRTKEHFKKSKKKAAIHI
ncbi:MAG: ImmA/IrrE family metallo-endopeptidase [Spirochaetaceae bacterium]|jgi:Zn-dependent peptidase ImmA (M78 family)|nr:ImmA/IrrE family metallo-endopeptidase [Spirochaetaceae bacterium]